MGGSTRFIFEEAGLHCDGAVKTSGADLRFHECVKDCLGVSRSAPLREDDADSHEATADALYNNALHQIRSSSSDESIITILETLLRSIADSKQSLSALSRKISSTASPLKAAVTAKATI